MSKYEGSTNLRPLYLPLIILKCFLTAFYLLLQKKSYVFIIITILISLNSNCSSLPKEETKYFLSIKNANHYSSLTKEIFNDKINKEQTKGTPFYKVVYNPPYIKEASFYDRNGELKLKYNFSYHKKSNITILVKDNNGQLIKEKHFKDNYLIKETILLPKNNNNNAIKKKIKLFSKTKNNKNLLTKLIVYKASNNKEILYKYFLYKKKLIKVIDREITLQNKKVISTLINSYDKKAKKIESSLFKEGILHKKIFYAEDGKIEEVWLYHTSKNYKTNNMPTKPKIKRKIYYDQYGNTL